MREREGGSEREHEGGSVPSLMLTHYLSLPPCLSLSLTLSLPLFPSLPPSASLSENVPCLANDYFSSIDQ